MSVYDPFGLYQHHQKKSHDGQVLRKKLIPPQNYAISEEMLKQAQEILIKAGIRGFNSSVPQRLFIFKQYPNLSTANFELPPAIETNLSFQFSNFWDIIKNDFAPIYNTVSPLSVTNISFIINFNSIIFGPSATVQAPTNLFIRVQFDGYSTPSGTPFAPQIQSGHTYISFSSYDSISFIREQDVATNVDGGGFVTKQTPTSHPFLSSVQNRSPAILTALKNSDYSVFNPTLIICLLRNLSDQYSVTFSNVIYNFSVELAVEYK